MLRGDTLTGRADHRQETCVQTSAKSTDSYRNGEHIADQVANGAITGPPVLISAASRGYRPPKMSGCVVYMGNVDLKAVQKPLDRLHR